MKENHEPWNRTVQESKTLTSLGIVPNMTLQFATKVVSDISTVLNSKYYVHNRGKKWSYFSVIKGHKSWTTQRLGPWWNRVHNPAADFKREAVTMQWQWKPEAEQDALIHCGNLKCIRFSLLRCFPLVQCVHIWKPLLSKTSRHGPCFLLKHWNMHLAGRVARKPWFSTM